MKKIKYLIIAGIVVFAFFAGWMMSGKENNIGMLEIHTYEDVITEIVTNNKEDNSEIYTEDVSEYTLSEENAHLFTTFTKEKLDEQMFVELDNEKIKNLYEKYKDAIVIYSNSTDNMYIADLRLSKGEIKSYCEYDETEQNYKYRIEYGEKVFEDVYEGEGVVALLISDFDCTKIEESDLKNVLSEINNGSVSFKNVFSYQ